MEHKNERNGMTTVKTLRYHNICCEILASRRAHNVLHKIVFKRSYKDDEGKVAYSDSFREQNLLLLAKLADEAHTWIWENRYAVHPETPTPEEPGLQGLNEDAES